MKTKSAEGSFDTNGKKENADSLIDYVEPEVAEGRLEGMDSEESRNESEADVAMKFCAHVFRNLATVIGSLGNVDKDTSDCGGVTMAAKICHDWSAVARKYALECETVDESKVLDGIVKIKKEVEGKRIDLAKARDRYQNAEKKLMKAEEERQSAILLVGYCASKVDECEEHLEDAKRTLAERKDALDSKRSSRQGQAFDARVERNLVYSGEKSVEVAKEAVRKAKQELQKARGSVGGFLRTIPKLMEEAYELKGVMRVAEFEKKRADAKLASEEARLHYYVALKHVEWGDAGINTMKEFFKAAIEKCKASRPERVQALKMTERAVSEAEMAEERLSKEEDAMYVEMANDEKAFEETVNLYRNGLEINALDVVRGDFVKARTTSGKKAMELAVDGMMDSDSDEF